MSLVYKLGADLTVILHLGYAACIVVGQLLIVAGAVRKWQWTRNVWVRSIHLAMILIVVVEGLLGIVCPLTTLEKWLRQQAGQVSYQGDFLVRWVHNLLFVECSPTILQALYTLFGLAVAVTFWRAPPRRRQRPLYASES